MFTRASRYFIVSSKIGDRLAGMILELINRALQININ